MRVRSGIPGVLLFLSMALACGGGGEEAEHEEDEPEEAAVAGGPVQPAPGGKIITVEMITDEKGNNIFRPAEFEAHKGDVIRYSLVVGVHNVNFLPDSNAGVAGLPGQAPMLQMPGQTFDVLVTWDPGRYYFQCDPHALLGMIGHVKVEDDDY